MNTTDPNKQNLQKCILMADVVLLNNSTKEDLFREVEISLQKILSTGM